VADRFRAEHRYHTATESAAREVIAIPSADGREIAGAGRDRWLSDAGSLVGELAMGIEPPRAPLPGLENKRFGAIANPKCDGRVNFRGMWGHVGILQCAKSRARGYQP
jgi:hypothetical protein